MQGEVRIDLNELAKQYGIKDLREARILPFSYGRRQTLMLVPAVVKIPPIPEGFAEEALKRQLGVPTPELLATYPDGDWLPEEVAG